MIYYFRGTNVGQLISVELELPLDQPSNQRLPVRHKACRT